MQKTPPPQSEQELLQRAEAIAGLSLKQIADKHNIEVPDNQQREKGWVGQLLELQLGATAGSKPVPDFEDIGVELKTLPINRNGKPKETTFVSMVQLQEVGGLTWETSYVKHKLSRVLWVPIESERDIPLAERKVGTALLWSSSAEQEAILKQDWEELTDMVALGQLDSITAKQGVYLQIRPKAANAKSLCWGIGESGAKILTLPRGFYLRNSFTAKIIEEHFGL